MNNPNFNSNMYVSKREIKTLLISDNHLIMMKLHEHDVIFALINRFSTILLDYALFDIIQIKY